MAAHDPVPLGVATSAELFDPVALQRCLRDVVALSTLPALWIDATPSQIATHVVDALRSMLRVELAYVGLTGSIVAPDYHVARTADTTSQAALGLTVGEALAPWLADATGGEPIWVPHPCGSGSVRLVVMPLGTAGELGRLALGTARADFPTDTDRLLLRVAANQAALALRSAQRFTEQQHAEQELRDFVDTATVSLHWVGPDGTILWANQAELDLLGYTREEYIGRHIAEFHADSEVIDEILSRLATNETLRNVEARLRCKDGTIKWVLIDSSVRWKNDTFLHTRCFTRDITARKQAEARYQALFEHAADAVLVADAVGRCLDANPAALALLGYEREVFLRHDFGDLLVQTREDGDANEVPFLVVDRWRGELALRRADGTVVPVDVQTAVVELPDGRVVLVIMRDITERTRVEQIHARLAAIVTSSDDAIVSKDLNGVIMSWNAGAERIFGYTAEEAVGQSIMILIPPNRLDEEPEILARIRRGERVDHFETVRRRKDGTLIDISLTVSPIVDGRGRIVGASKIARDITEQRTLERQKNAFLGIAAHELRTPVTGIKAYTQLLARRLRRAGDTSVVDVLDRLDAQATRLNGLITDLLDVTRLEGGALPFRPALFDLNLLLCEVIDEAQQTTSQHRILTEFDARVMLVGDRDRIGQVVMNLLTNAIKYSPQADRIIVRTTRDSQHVVLQVQDFGIGIPEADRSRIFDRFYRVTADGRDGYAGMGLGLYIAAEFITRHGGSIWVERDAGPGTTIAVSLPLGESQDIRDDDTTSLN